MNELFYSNKLVTEKEWFDIIDNIDGKGLEYPIIKEVIINGIKNRIKEKKVGIMFSGGVDSTIIAKVLIDKLGKENVVLVTVGCHDEGRKIPEDISIAQDIAEELGTNTNIILLSEEETLKIFDETIRILKMHDKGLINSVNVSVGAVEVAAYKFLKSLKIKQVFSGLGSEEIFAGYQRHEQTEDLNLLSKNSLKEMYARDLLRETLLSKHFNIKASTPFMDSELLNHVFGIKKELKIGIDNKMAVRMIAKDLHLSNAFRKKKAAQYGSRTQQYLEKICKKKGFNNINDCLIQWN